jgi:hypothetical protein
LRERTKKEQGHRSEGCALLKESTMANATAWVRFRDLPDDMLDDMPDHVRSTFLAARRDGFEVEMLCPGGRPSRKQRAPKRFVLVADDLGGDDGGGPMAFDLAALAHDVQASRRLFIVSTQPGAELYAAAYAAAVEDLGSGFAAAVVVETRPAFAEDWARTLAALSDGGNPAAAALNANATTPPKTNGPLTRGRRAC